MPFCRDCAYCLPDGFPKDGPDAYKFARCQNAATGAVNLVSGARELAYCAVARQPGGGCEPAGKFYEPMVTIGHPEDQDATVGATVLG